MPSPSPSCSALTTCYLPLLLPRPLSLTLAAYYCLLPLRGGEQSGRDVTSVPNPNPNRRRAIWSRRHFCTLP
eukprot:scaffold117529_cov24-Phaeocystis_antarctica.AAC.2